MIKITHWIKEYQLQGLKELADKTGDKVSEHIRRALDQYIRREKKK
jgi:predicted transcriptional regulator